MKIRVTNKIYVAAPPKPMAEAMVKTLTLENPMFTQMAKRCKYVTDPKLRQQFKRALFGIKQNFKFYKENNGTYIIGRGCEERVKKVAKSLGWDDICEYDLIDEPPKKILNGEIKLRGYQEGVIEEILPHNTGVIKLSTGWGKTVVALKLIETIKKPTLIICHQDKEVAKYRADLLKYYNYKAGILQGSSMDLQPVTIASIATLTRRDLTTISKYFSMIIVDECFDGETMVETDYGHKKIKDIKEGDIVKNAVGYGMVVKTTKQLVNSLINIKLNNDNILVTENHPFFTVNGWKTVRNIKKGDLLLTTNFVNDIMSKDIKSLIKLYGRKQMRFLWENFYSKTQIQEKYNLFSRLQIFFYFKKKTSEIISLYKKEISRESGCFQEERGNTFQISIGASRTQTESVGKNEERQSDESPRHKRENDKYAEKNWSQAEGARWEWTRDASPPENFISGTRRRVVCGIHCSIKIFKNKLFRNKFANTLQDRYSKSKIKNSDRNRWWLSLFNIKTGTRQEKGKDVAFARVEGFEVQKPRNFDEFTNGFAVYNLSVDRHPSYSANGLLVHNCQLYVSDKRIAAIQSFNPSRLYGMSGTPERDDGLTNAIFFTFGDIIVDRKLPQVAPKVQIIKSLTAIQVDDYADMIAKMVGNEERNRTICNLASHEVKLGRRIIILTKRTIHYQLLAQALTAKGYAVKMVQSGLNTEETKLQNELLEELGNGSVNFDVILGTYSLLAVGANIPALDTLIFAGDLRAKMLSTQAIGRILRLFDGKKDPLVIDIDDFLNPILHSQAQARKRLYKENGWEIITVR